MLKIPKNFIAATAILVIGSMTAATSYWFAHEDQDIRFTLLGFAAAVFSGMYYGLSIESSKIRKSTVNSTA